MRITARVLLFATLIVAVLAMAGCCAAPPSGTGGAGGPDGEGSSVTKTDMPEGDDASVAAGDLEESFIAFCLGFGTGAAGGDTSALGTLTVTDVRIIEDSTGRWWGSGVVQPSVAGQESLWMWGSWDGTAWSGRDAGGDEPSVFFPADVVAGL